MVLQLVSSISAAGNGNTKRDKLQHAKNKFFDSRWFHHQWSKRWRLVLRISIPGNRNTERDCRFHGTLDSPAVSPVCYSILEIQREDGPTDAHHLGHKTRHSGTHRKLSTHENLACQPCDQNTTAQKNHFLTFIFLLSLASRMTQK